MEIMAGRGVKLGGLEEEWAIERAGASVAEMGYVAGARGWMTRSEMEYRSAEAVIS